MSARTRILSLAGIIVVGFVLRWAGLFWGEGYHFSGMTDELLANRVAHGIEAGEERALYIGQPNFKGGKVPGPLWGLFWLAGLKLGGSADAVCLMMIVLNTVAIYLVYRLAGALLGPTCSLWAALFFATSPWPVHYSVGVWNPLLMAFLGALLYLALWDVVNRPESRNIFWVCFVLAMMPHFHMMVMFVAPVMVLVLWLGPARLNRRWLAGGVVASVALYVPYLVGEARHHWDNTHRVLAGDVETSLAVFKIFTLPVTDLSNLMSSTTGREFSVYRAWGDMCFGSFWVLAAFNVLSLVLSLVAVGDFLAGLVRVLRGKWRSPRQAFAAAPAEVFIGALLILPLLLFIASFRNFNSRYLIVQYPLLFLLPAILMARGLANHRWHAPVRTLMILTIAFNVYLSLAYFHFQAERLARADYFLPSFRKMESVSRHLHTDAGSNYRVRIDDNFYRENWPKKYTEGIVNLADYIDLQEQYAPATSQSLPYKTYQVRAAADKLETNERAVFTTNGVVFITSD